MLLFLFFFFNDTATTEIYTLSLHDALPIFALPRPAEMRINDEGGTEGVGAHHRSPERISVSVPRIAAAADRTALQRDRKSTRLNSSHLVISYAVFCLKKKKNVSYPWGTLLS